MEKLQVPKDCKVQVDVGWLLTLRDEVNRLLLDAGDKDKNEKPSNPTSIGDWFRALDPDFRRVQWGEELFNFSPRAAKAVQALCKNYIDGDTGLSSKELREAAGSVGDRTRDIFKEEAGISSAWGTMVQRRGTRFHIVPPEAKS